jgi:hypothetical protein
MKTYHFVLLFSLLLFSVSFSAGVNINECNDSDAIINLPEAYFVDTNLVGAPNLHYSGFNACILINSSDVIVDCQGFSITNNGTVNAVGILAYNSPSTVLSNITIKNCPDISNGYVHSIGLLYANNSTITNVSVSNATSNGIMLFSVNDSHVTYANSSNSSYGIILSYSNNNSVSDIVVANNTASGVLVNFDSTMNSLNSIYAYNNSPALQY